MAGSSSDRPLPVRQAIWDRHNIKVSFVSPEQGLFNVKSRVKDEEYSHIDDMELDRQFDLALGFHFIWVDTGNTEPGINGRTTQD